MRSILALLPFLFTSQALELTPSNWDEKTAGKTVFLKMFAAWCGHCKAMKPAWDAVMKDFADSDIVLMADVDCVGAGKELCNKNGVKGFPTIKFGDPNALEDYKGGRDEESLRKFASELKPSCDVSTLDHCSDDQKEVVKTMQALDLDELEKMLSAAEAGIMGFEAQFEKNIKELQAKYETYVTAKEEGIAELEKTSNIGILKSVVQSKKASGKGEL